MQSKNVTRLTDTLCTKNLSAEGVQHELGRCDVWLGGEGVPQKHES